MEERGLKRLLASVALIAFSIMFSISVVGPLLSALSKAENVPLGPRPNTSIGIIFALGGLSLAAFQIPFARLADRLGRRKFIFWGSIGVAISVVLIGFVGPISKIIGAKRISLGNVGWDGSTLLLAIARTLQGIAAAATWPILMSLLASEVPVEMMGTAMGVFGASFGLGMSLGPVVGPAVASVSRIETPFIISSVLALVAAGMSMIIRETRMREISRSRRTRIADLRLISLSLVAFTLLYGMGSIVVIYPKYITDLIGGSLKDVAVAMALASLTYTFLQPLTGRLADMLDKKLLVIIGLIINSISASLLGRAATVNQVYLLMLLFGVSGAVVFPASTALVSIIAPKGSEGAYTGFYNAMLSFGVTLSPIVVGIISDISSYATAYLSVLPLALVSLILVYISIKE